MASYFVVVVDVVDVSVLVVLVEVTVVLVVVVAVVVEIVVVVVGQTLQRKGHNFGKRTTASQYCASNGAVPHPDSSGGP